MPCQYCGIDNAAADDDAANGVSPSSPYCPTCEPLMREAFALLLAGLADLFAAQREQEAAEKQAAA
jgi:hypothetical protein